MMRLLLILCLSLLTLVPPLRAAQGIIQTTDGKKFEGDIHLENGGFKVAGTNGASDAIAVHQLALLRIGTNHLTRPLEPETGANPDSTPPPHGLLGIYFNAPDLAGEFRFRYDPTVDFDWGEGAPCPGVNPDDFSVRWTGKVVPRFSEHYTFHTMSEDGVRLWIDGKLVIDAWREESLNMASVPLVLSAGRSYDLRMEMFNATGRALARLSWSSPSTPIDIIPAEQLLPAPPPAPAALATARQTIPAGVLMTGGSIIARRIYSADETTVRFSESANDPSLSTVNVARLHFQPLRGEMITAPQPGRVGLLLTNRDFVDAEFVGFKEGTVTISSVLYGRKSYDAKQVIAATLRDLRPDAARYEIRTRDGSVLLCNTMRVGDGFILLQDPALAGLTVPATELVELKSAGRP